MKDIIDLENICFGENHGGHFFQRLVRLEGMVLGENTSRYRYEHRNAFVSSRIEHLVEEMFRDE